ncbi:bifunctional serine/threonine-protein kinase/ABC transporter substrate-binding protein [Streptomyces sp. NPDC020965]|uniref:bifunctional serine/threonine-protein kinase/ABC transporter substrate-binding protein n=1 Tax=Streptomyces sp. NPDC020965 TaxID=3365105 RepID=UPI0037AF62DE
MDPLTRSDPSSIAGYRLLGRLGAGGMGVVYLARSGRGALAALKVIRREHAADPGFRARFRRETEIAGRITGRWVVRVVGADPEAAEPWLATEFVPGPALAEAVAAHGPLPARTVRALGGRLAEALAGTHAAGLVHRDVKPGNVLLALDGPRLIDFGIARSAGATALTATDVMIGSPGYLSPEQARAAGAGTVGPPSDIFSLGCVLAYATTGRRPFGTGTVAAIVFRTVHEEPDLDGVPPALLEPIRACLAKDPADRPSAQDLRGALGDVPDADWLPAGLPALIAERSSRVLDLPVPEPTVVVAPAPAGGPSRRRFLVLGSAAGVVTAGGVTAWLANRPSGSSDGTGSGPRPRHVIGVQTDLSGPGAADGKAQERGARLAVETFNARRDRPFDLALKVLDDAGDPKRALAAAETFGADRSVVSVLGPTTTAVAAAVAKQYLTDLLPVATVSVGATPFAISRRGAYFELRPADDLLLTPVTAYFVTRRTRRLAVVEDRAGGDFAWSMVKTLRESGAGPDGMTFHQVAAESADFATVTRAALAGRPDGVIYAGVSPARAALLALALRAKGFTGPRGAVEPVMEAAFLTGAGAAADGWVFGTSYADPTRLPAAKTFTAAYRKRWRTTEIERHAVEAYDAVLFLAQGIRELDTDRVDRGALVRRLRELRYRGIATTITFRDDTGLFDHKEGGLYTWRVAGGRPRFLGGYKSVTAKT